MAGQNGGEEAERASTGSVAFLSAMKLPVNQPLVGPGILSMWLSTPACFKSLLSKSIMPQIPHRSL